MSDASTDTLEPTADPGRGGRAQHVTEGVFFTTPPALPRGRHTMTRDQVTAVHRERAMIAATELMAIDGYRGVGVREISARAAVSRAAFYECFTDKDACVNAAYDRFIDVLLHRLAAVHHPTGTDWTGYVSDFVTAYLHTLQQDLVVARAFQVEMDALGFEARKRRREALTGLAHLLRAKHAEWTPGTSHLLDPSAYIGVVYAVRQLACDALDEHQHPDLLTLAPKLVPWISQLRSETPPT